MIYEGDISSKMLLSYTFSFLINQTPMKPFVPRSDSQAIPLHVLFERKHCIPCLTSSHPLHFITIHNWIFATQLPSPPFIGLHSNITENFYSKVSNDFLFPNTVNEVLIFILPLWYSRPLTLGEIYLKNIMHPRFLNITIAYNVIITCNGLQLKNFADSDS